MLRKVVAHINTELETLDFVKETKGVAQIIKEQRGNDEVAFPAIYDTKGEYKHVSDFDFKQSLIYHRLTAEVGIAEDESKSVTACSQYLVQTFPMIMIACIQKSLTGDDTILIEQRIAETLKNKIGSSNVASLQDSLQVDTVSIIPSGYDIDRYSVFAVEYVGLPMEIGFEYAYISLSYDVIISADINCFENICE